MARASQLLNVQADPNTSSRVAALKETAYWLLLSTTTSAPSGSGRSTFSSAEGGNERGSNPCGVYGACSASGHQWWAWRLNARSSGRSCASAQLSGTTKSRSTSSHCSASSLGSSLMNRNSRSASSLMSSLLCSARRQLRVKNESRRQRPTLRPRSKSSEGAHRTALRLRSASSGAVRLETQMVSTSQYKPPYRWSSSQRR
mmetsp:Transcript_22627/g.46101  ORF Transcript_22627/g.46101 Transcript_22627/m.46101 type:complete len:201 (-) Transcript_22627:377-979(-)